MPIPQLLLDLLLSQTTLAFGIGLLTGVLIMWLPKFIARIQLRGKVESAYDMLRMACEPEIVNPAHPASTDYVQSEARDRVNVLINQLKKAGFFPPPRCDRSPESLEKWFTFLSDVRSELAPSWFK